MSVTTVFRALLLVFGMVFGLIVLFYGSTSFKNPGWIVGISLIVGFGLLLAHRITEFTIPNVGTIKAATEQATADAGAIAAIKDNIQNQSATINLVANQATKAHELSETASKAIKKAEERLNSLNLVIANATSTLAKLKDEAEFTALVVAAENDDRQLRQT